MPELTALMSIPTPMAVGLLLSGGLDSAILLGTLLGHGCRVQPFYVRSHLAWEAEELATVRQLLRAMASPCLAELVVFDTPADDLYGDHWSVTGRGVPEADTPAADVFLPGRNALLLIKPAIWCSLHGIQELAVAVLATNPFGDATPEFLGDFQAALCRATGAMVAAFGSLAQIAEEAGHGTRPPFATGFDLLLPFAGRRPALWTLQQVPGENPSVPHGRDGRSTRYADAREEK